MHDDNGRAHVARRVETGYDNLRPTAARLVTDKTATEEAQRRRREKQFGRQKQ
jgi:hypothetical protein